MTIAAEPFKDRLAGIYGMVCLAALAGTLVWATFAPLAEGVVASGAVTVDDNRKKVQHLEGGIIRTIAVREGASVRQGDVLFELDNIGARAQRDQAAQEYAGLLLSQARLEAFLAGRHQMDGVDLSGLGIAPGVESELRRQQGDLFYQQKRWLSADGNLMRARQSNLMSSSQSKQGQIVAQEAALKASRDELALNEQLLAMQMVKIDHVQQLRRQVAGQEAELSRLRSESTMDGLQASTVDQEVARARAEAFRNASTELVQVKTELLTTRERLSAADDVLERKIIRAPRSGVVLNLAFSTLGGVVQAGEPLLEIVPQDTSLIAQVRINPTDRNDVYDGQAVLAQISAFDSWKAPRIPGKVLGVSADLKRDQQTGASYYEARIELDQSRLRRDQLSVRPGMPVEAFIASGRTRTAIDYFFEPLLAVVRRGFVAQ
ncbi:HlyD family type I secretion periplasmic adaptor subunit [Asticcacaulis sp. AC402]|uniref:HlyD family type I secretion periplasmic adaptor subunit n=1 Tax=Asticcacaulis sp. AC402 TaxID=1282361 RepID=UPI0003C3F394|nr:HlyD family type I secretion periplasmic adaptor subunit [Asticcacaulis sp. AC402]ESQ76982.1 hypothetical protein ABAC402_02605 [Asticcacaulis sp. AC402]